MKADELLQSFREHRQRAHLIGGMPAVLEPGTCLATTVTTTYHRKG